MATTTVRWVSERQFVGEDENHHAVVLSGDDPAKGVRPSQMLLIALSACSGYDVVEILEKKRKTLSHFEVTAAGEHAPDAPYAFQTIHLKYRLGGKDLTEKAVTQAIELSQEKYCSVAATIRGVAKITYEFEIL